MGKALKTDQKADKAQYICGTVSFSRTTDQKVLEAVREIRGTTGDGESN